MGLSNFPSAAEGVLPVLVMNTVMSVAILKNLVRSVLQLLGATFDENPTTTATSEVLSLCKPYSTRRGVSITKFKSCTYATTLVGECCVCLSKFEEDEEVSELSCKHFFHRNCLDKWFGNHHSTCPLCRSIH